MESTFGRMYTTEQNVTLSASEATRVDFFEARPNENNDVVLILHEIEFTVFSDEGEGEERNFVLNFRSGVTSGSGGNTADASYQTVNQAADSDLLGAEEENITQATGGVKHYVWGMNSTRGFRHVWTPETRPVINPGRIFAFGLEADNPDYPTRSLSARFVLVYEELGG